MPELAEVEHGRRVAERIALGRTIVEADVADDDIVVQGTTWSDVRDAATGAKVIGTGRHGKHLWLDLEGRPSLLMHFGMTGGFRTRGDDPLILENSPKEVDRAWPPRFTKIRLVFHDGGELAMTNARRLGRIRLRDDVRGSPPVSKLGYDPLLELPSAADWDRRIGRRKTVVKSLLLDQSFAAGVGNWIADEALYQARIDPRTRIHELTPQRRTRLRKVIHDIVDTAVAVDARKDEFPEDWLFHHRWGRKEGARTADGRPISFLDIGGRTTAWVPSRQK